MFRPHGVRESRTLPAPPKNSAGLRPAAHDARSLRFEAQVRPHLGSMLRVARALLHSEDLAWDAVQEVLARAWQRPEWPADPGPWLRALTHLAGRHARRTLARRARHEERGGSLRPRDEVPSPVLTCERHETCRVLQEALGELAPEQREVLVLHELEGLAYGDVARRLAVPVGTVRSRLSRARARLREVLLRRLRDLDLGLDP